jgi:hypothetical protein
VNRAQGKEIVGSRKWVKKEASPQMKIWQPTREKEAEEASNEKRRQPTKKEAHNEEAVFDCCGIEEEKEEGGIVDCCGSVEAEEADNERTTRPTDNEEGKEEECECVEMPKSPPRHKITATAEMRTSS